MNINDEWTNTMVDMLVSELEESDFTESEMKRASRKVARFMAPTVAAEFSGRLTVDQAENDMYRLCLAYCEFCSQSYGMNGQEKEEFAARKNPWRTDPWRNN